MPFQPSDFLDEIFSLEARGMFSDLTTIPKLFLKFTKLSKEQCKEGIDYIKNTLKHCHDVGGSQVLIYNNEDKLIGYLIVFIDPTNKESVYLHKVFVKEEYRRNGIGTEFLNSLRNSNFTITLLSPPDKIPFYKKNGFYELNQFNVPDKDNFQLLEGFYSDLVFMNNTGRYENSPIFLLNDQDLAKILKI